MGNYVIKQDLTDLFIHFFSGLCPVQRRERKAFPDSKKVIECFSRFLGENGIGNYFQLGGNSTLDKGIIRAVLGEIEKHE
ncbi:MAG: hypothetical protein SVR94_04570 [Pseudomonadota bacterium]|nr:hypothetical protein [Pseudomonadota bacterium]